MSDREGAFKRDFRELADDGFGEGDLEDATKLLHVFRFRASDKDSTVPMTTFNKKSAFLDKFYEGEAVHPGDVWFCKVTYFNGKAYYVMPLKRVSYNTMMGMNDEIREDVIDALWGENRDELEEEFEGRYKAEVYAKAYEDAKAENQANVDKLMERIDSLEQQLELARMVNAGRGPSDGGAEQPPDEEGSGSVSLEPPIGTEVPPRPARRGPFRQRRGVPGMPEISRPEAREEEAPYEVRLERVGEEQIWCGELEDGQYFVHITPSGKYLVVRPNPFGQVACANHTLTLRGLGKYSTYTVPTELKGEYSAYYDGLVVTLGTKAQAQNPEDAGEESDAVL